MSDTQALKIALERIAALEAQAKSKITIKMQDYGDGKQGYVQLVGISSGGWKGNSNTPQGWLEVFEQKDTLLAFMTANAAEISKRKTPYPTTRK